jgi:MoxR-like ATPase
MNKKWPEFEGGEVVTLDVSGASTEIVHVFDKPSIDAINAALAAKRPLLVRGEPGTGKSQLACAAAKAMNRPYLPFVVDSRTTAQDLLWHFDAVARLAEAQLAGALKWSPEEVRQRLDVRSFVTPRPLWWALNWKSAAKQAEAAKIEIPKTPEGWQPGQGAVVLIDEIDKADSDLPNGLLEVLGQGSFRPEGFDKGFGLEGEMPLVIITTNEERSLPDAFLRRCLVLHIDLPRDRDQLRDLLVARGRAHFGTRASDKVLAEAAQQLIEDREDLQKRNLPAPGQAEYLDLVRALTNHKASEAEQLAWLATIKDFVLQKHARDSQA